MLHVVRFPAQPCIRWRTADRCRHEISPRDKFVGIASDGGFEFLPSQAVVEMVSKFNDQLEAAVHVASESYRLWLQARSRMHARAHVSECPSEPCRRQCLRVGQRVAPLPRLPSDGTALASHHRSRGSPLQYEVRSDDITIIIIVLEGLENEAEKTSSSTSPANNKQSQLPPTPG